ncbi:MAG TPA: hypothetical protein VF691_21420 [Cytophagaceae bacterium]|jgi:hypothetical protein
MRYPLIGKDFSLSDEDDFSGIGVNMKWLTPDEQIDEGFNNYPGMAAGSVWIYPGWYLFIWIRRSILR